jgi:hypothetical protein
MFLLFHLGLNPIKFIFTRTSVDPAHRIVEIRTVLFLSERGLTLQSRNPNFDHLFIAAGAFLTGAWWVKNQTDEAKKSRAEREDPDHVEEICSAVGPILDAWEPQGCSNEGEFVEALFDYLDSEIADDWEIEMCPGTPEGKPDLLIDDCLALEVKISPGKSECDRVVGQAAGYSRRWVTWIVLIDTSASRVGTLESLLKDKGLDRILIFDFS